MSDTYFESWNGDYFQLSDSTKLIHIVRRERIVANTYEKQMHGIVLEDGIAGVSYFVKNATLWISPITFYNGQRIQYVTSDTDQPIDVYYWSYDYFEPMEHGVGIELCDSSGNVVFNSNGSLGSFKSSFLSTVTSYQKVLPLQDIPRIGDYWACKGLSALYFAIASKFWGVYNYTYSTAEASKEWDGFIDIEEKMEEQGYCYNSPHSPMFQCTSWRWDVYPRYDVAYRVWPQRVDLYRTGLYGYIDNKSSELTHVIRDEIHPIYEGHDEGHGKHHSMTYVLVGTETVHIDRWEEIQHDTFVTIDNRWSFEGSPTCSLMMPFSIWLPAIVSEKGDKDIVHAVGVKFTASGRNYKMELDDHLETLYVKTITGSGSIDHLNKVQYSSSEGQTRPKNPTGYNAPRYDDDDEIEGEYIMPYHQYPNGINEPDYYAWPTSDMVEGVDYRWCGSKPLDQISNAMADFSDGIVKGSARAYQDIASGCITEGVSCDICLALVLSTT